MSGINTDHNKFHSCQNCPDRCIEPNCHMTCEGFLFRQKKKEEEKQKIKDGRNEGKEFIEFKKDVVAKTKKRFKV